MAASGKPTAAIQKRLARFLDTLATIKVLDPACGSGNFLYVSLKQLKDLEQQVIALAASFGLHEFELRVSPAQLYGIEKDHFAQQLASIVVWIGYLQWKLKNGYETAGETPILKPLNNIQCLDVILVFSSLSSVNSSQPSAISGQPSAPPQSKIGNLKSKIV